MKNRFAAYAVAFIHRNNKVLFVKRSEKAPFSPGYYSLVGGLLEKNEPFRQALARELHEEIGVTVDESDLHFVHMFHRNGSEHEMVVSVFECTAFQGEPFNKEPEKHSEIFWADLDNLPELIIPAHRNVLQLIKEKQFYSEQP